MAPVDEQQGPTPKQARINERPVMTIHEFSTRRWHGQNRTVQHASVHWDHLAVSDQKRAKYTQEGVGPEDEVEEGYFWEEEETVMALRDGIITHTDQYWDRAFDLMTHGKGNSLMLAGYMGRYPTTPFLVLRFSTTMINAWTQHEYLERYWQQQLPRVCDKQKSWTVPGVRNLVLPVRDNFAKRAAVHAVDGSKQMYVGGGGPECGGRCKMTEFPQVTTWQATWHKWWELAFEHIGSADGQALILPGALAAQLAAASSMEGGEYGNSSIPGL